MLEMRLVQSALDYEAMFKLRYQAYRRVGAIPLRSDGLFKDEFDNFQSTKSFNFYDDDNLVASVRVCIVTDEDDEELVPSQKVFQGVFSQMLQSNFTLIEVNRLVVEVNQRFSLHFKIFREIHQFALKINATHLCAATRTSQENFYNRMFGLRRVSDEQKYYGIDARMVLMWGDRDCFSWDYIQKMRSRCRDDGVVI